MSPQQWKRPPLPEETFTDRLIDLLAAIHGDRVLIIPKQRLNFDFFAILFPIEAGG